MNGSWPFLIPITAIVSIFIVMPWMKMRHEERKREIERGIGLDRAESDMLARRADELERRVKTLEAILDDQAPGWRRKTDD